MIVFVLVFFCVSAYFFLCVCVFFLCVCCFCLLVFWLFVSFFVCKARSSCLSLDLNKIGSSGIILDRHEYKLSFST